MRNFPADFHRLRLCRFLDDESQTGGGRILPTGQGASGDAIMSERHRLPGAFDKSLVSMQRAPSRGMHSRRFRLP